MVVSFHPRITANFRSIPSRPFASFADDPFFNNRLHPPHDAARQSHFDSVRMLRRIGQDLLHDALRQLPRALVLFLDDFNFRAGRNVRPTLWIFHRDFTAASVTEVTSQVNKS
jgi:hypothetical protein